MDDFSNAFNVYKLGECLKFWQIGKYWIWGMLKSKVWSEKLEDKYQIVQHHNNTFSTNLFPSQINIISPKKQPECPFNGLSWEEKG